MMIDGKIKSIISIPRKFMQNRHKNMDMLLVIEHRITNRATNQPRTLFKTKIITTIIIIK